MNYYTASDLFAAAPLMGGALSTSDALDAQLFGSPRLSWRGAPLRLVSQKGSALLYVLAATPEGLTRDELAELLWGPGRYANLRQALYQLRQLPGARAWLHDDERRVRVAVKSDLTRFRAALKAQRYAEVLELSEGALLGDVRVADAPAFEDWLSERRSSVEDERRAALRGEVARLEARGDLSGALELTRHLIALEPLDETSYRAAMRLHYRQGDLAAASEQFAACRRVMMLELGVEPLSETLELAHLIEKSRAEGLPQQSATLPLQLLRPPHLVGRGEVWAQMLAAQRAGKVIFLEGVAGVGKTRLLRDFTRHLGSAIFNEARPGDVHSPYIVLARGLHRFLAAHPEVQLADWERLALARLLPQLPQENTQEVPQGFLAHASHMHRYTPGLTPSPLDTPGKCLRFTEALTSLFERMRRSVAALPADDIHYIDHASHRLAAQVFAQLVTRSASAAIIVAYRPEETPEGFERYVAPLLESGVGVRLKVEPLDSSAVGELVESLGLPGGVELARRLHRYAGGNPMLTLETLKSMKRSGDLKAAPLLDLSTLDLPIFDLHAPSQAGALIRRRLETLSPLALRVARAKALSQGQVSVDVHTLADIVEMTPLAVAEGLEELEHAQVLAGEHFVHDLIYEAVLAHIPRALARILHERTALVLEAQVARQPERIAQHWLGARKGEKAAPYLLQAALAARHIRADKEARLRYFQTLWCTSESSDFAQRAEAKALRKRALKGLSTLADLTHDVALKREVLRRLEALGASYLADPSRAPCHTLE